MTSAAYYRAWRAAHPEYRERQRTLRNERRRRYGREDRTAEYARRVQPPVPLPAPFLGHPLFDRAREIVGRPRSGFTVLQDPLHEDLLSVAVVALVEGTDPRAAVDAFRRNETNWRRHVGPLLGEVAA